LVSQLKNQLKGNVMHDDKVYELASELYFYFIDLYGVRDHYVIDHKDYSENTDMGRDLYYQIEDELINNTRPLKN